MKQLWRETKSLYKPWSVNLLNKRLLLPLLFLIGLFGETHLNAATTVFYDNCSTSSQWITQITLPYSYSGDVITKWKLGPSRFSFYEGLYISASDNIVSKKFLIAPNNTPTLTLDIGWSLLLNPLKLQIQDYLYIYEEIYERDNINVRRSRRTLLYRATPSIQTLKTMTLPMTNSGSRGGYYRLIISVASNFNNSMAAQCDVDNVKVIIP